MFLSSLRRCRSSELDFSVSPEIMLSSPSSSSSASLCNSALAPPPPHLLGFASSSTSTVDYSPLSSPVSPESGLTSFDERFIDLLSTALERMIANTNTAAGTHVVDIFCANRVPDISISDYLKRLFKYCNAKGGGSYSAHALSTSAQALVCTLVYIDRLVSRTALIVHGRNIHRLLASGMLLAFKMNEDMCIPMKVYTKVCGVAMHDLKQLEASFLAGLGYSATVSKQEFDFRLKRFVAKMKL